MSFKVKGSGADKIHYALHSNLQYADQEVRIDKLERGVKRITRFARESDAAFVQTGDVTAGGSWTTVTKTFAFQTRGRELPDGTKANLALRVYFALTRPDAAVYFDDFQLVEQGK